MPRLPSLLREAADAVASLIFPAPCRVCEAPLSNASRIPVCLACLNSLKRIETPLCMVCGRPFFSPALAGNALCHLCRRNVYAFERARSFAVYDEVMIRTIILLKYHAVAPLGTWFAERLSETVRGDAKSFSADVVVPVPLHPARRRERGYNQAELIAKPLARRLGLPMRSELLVRTKPRPDKLKLTRRERWTSVRGAYGTREDSTVDKLRVLLVDDVFTTGATLDACSRALLQAGAAAVIGLTAARVVPDWVQPQRAAQE